MDATRALTMKKIGDSRKPPPKVVVWIAPSGLPVSCNDLDEASQLATRLAGEHPGKTVSMYELIGTAFVPITYPKVIPADRESEKLSLPACDEQG